MAELLRHRQTKEAVTDMFTLQPPRHIPTLPFSTEMVKAEGSYMSASPVRRDKAALSSGCKSHPANAPAGSNRSSHGGNEVAEAFG